MVGGKIVGLARGRDSTLVHVLDSHSKDECSIRIKEYRVDNGERVVVSVGDSIWWQGDSAMWTPSSCDKTVVDDCGVVWDIHLPRIGCSH